MPTVMLTPEFIKTGLQCPPGRNSIEFCDAKEPNLYVEVAAGTPGRGIYRLRYKADGKTCRHKIGRTTDITLAEARAQAKRLKAETQLGEIARGQKKAFVGAVTLGALFDGHYLPFVKPRKRSWDRDVQLFRRLRDKFGGRRIDQITRQEVQTFHAALLMEGLSPASADHHVKLFRQMLNLAVEWDMLEKNPVARVRLFMVDNKVENYLDEAQFARLMAVLRADPNRSVCWIALFLLSTGCRLNEALGATWAQIDRGTRVWRIPAATSKSKKVRSVPLNDSALDVITQLDTEGSFDHLFINRRTGLPYTTIMKVWSRIRAEAGVPFLRIHDLRHMYASFLVNSGRTLYEVQQILGHSDPSVTQRYAHLSTESLQAAANTASVAINDAVRHVA